MSDICDGLREKLREAIAQRNETRKLIEEILVFLDPCGRGSSVILAKIAIARKRWAEEKRKTSGG